MKILASSIVHNVTYQVGHFFYTVIYPVRYIIENMNHHTESAMFFKLIPKQLPIC